MTRTPKTKRTRPAAPAPTEATTFTLVDAPPETPPASKAPARTRSGATDRKKRAAKGSSRAPFPSRLDPYVDQIGVLSDGRVAALAGVTRAAVQMYRRRHGIAPGAAFARAPKRKAEEPKAVQIVQPDTRPASPVAAEPVSARPAPVRTKKKIGRPSKIDQFLDRVGVLPDAEIASLAGVAVSTVKAWRKIKKKKRSGPSKRAGLPRPAPKRQRAVRAAAPVEVAPVEAAPVEVAPAEAAPVEVAPAEAVLPPSGRTLSDRAEVMLQALARMRGIDPDTALSVAVAEDYLRCRRTLGRDLE